jgi:hypothetical protein
LSREGGKMETLPISKVLREAIKTLPGPDASLRQLIEFCGNHDPTTEFRERWGSDFQIKARDLWADSTDAFKNQRFSSADADELLLCMAYNVAVSPHLSIPEATSHAYLHWVLRELREKLALEPISSPGETSARGS